MGEVIHSTVVICIWRPKRLRWLSSHSGSGDNVHTVRTGKSLPHGSADRTRNLSPTRAVWFGIRAAHARPSGEATHASQT